MAAVMQEAERAFLEGAGEDVPEVDVDERTRILEAIALELSKCRSEAIAARQQSGIEDEWTEDEEFYEGIDDANRGEMNAWRSKPMGMATPSTAEKDKADPTSSTVFFNITRPYVDMAAARMGDMLLPVDDRGWSIQPTPVPEWVDIAKGKLPAKIEQQIEQAPEFAQLPPDQKQAKIAQTKQDALDGETKLMQQALERARKAEKRIEDWHVEGQFNAETRLMIKDSAKIGTGVLKGPVPSFKKTRAYANGQMQMQLELRPESRRIDAWNLFPDGACGENIHNGSYIWERDEISSKRLAQLLDDPTYLADQITEALKEGPTRATKEFKDGTGPKGIVQRTDTKTMFEIWYYYGELTRQQLENAGCSCDPEDAGDGNASTSEGLDTSLVGSDKQETEPYERFECMLTMVNNRVIKAALNPLSTGEFPYDVFPWQLRAGYWAGIGVARQIRTPQRVVNGAARNLMDNAGLAGGPMWIYRAGIVEPADGGVPMIGPRMGWTVAEDAEIEDVEEAFRFIVFPMERENLEAIIMLGMRMAEDVLGMPSMLQGQSNQSAKGGSGPATLGALQLQQNNAGAPMRGLARNFDDYCTTPHVRRYYAYLLQDPSVPDDEKGDYQVDARGSSALVQRDLQNQAIAGMMNMVVNPMFGKDPKKWATEYLKSQHLDPDRFEYDDEDWKKLVEALTQQAQQGAQGGGDGGAVQMQIAQMRAQIDQMKIAADDKHKDADRNLKIADMAAKNQQAGRDQQMEIALKAIDQQLEDKKLTVTERQTLENIKADLSKLVMTLNTQVAMSNADRANEQVDVQQERQHEVQMTDMEHQHEHQVEDKAHEHEHRMTIEQHAHDLEIAKAAAEPSGKAKPGKSFQG